MSVVVDVDAREFGSRVPDELERIGASVRRVLLPVGDYAVGRGVLVERKSVPDLHWSLTQGRYWRQIGGLRRQSAWPVVLVEGSRLQSGPIATDAIRGTILATAEQGIVVLRSEDAADSAAWLYRLAARADAVRRDRPPYAQTKKCEPAEVPEAMLAAVPGISTVLARSLLREFKTVAGVIAAGPDAWLRVPGIGDERADALQAAFHRRRPL